MPLSEEQEAMIDDILETQNREILCLLVEGYNSAVEGYELAKEYAEKLEEQNKMLVGRMFEVCLN